MSIRNDDASNLAWLEREGRDRERTADLDRELAAAREECETKERRILSLESELQGYMRRCTEASWHAQVSRADAAERELAAARTDLNAEQASHCRTSTMLNARLRKLEAAIDVSKFKYEGCAEGTEWTKPPVAPPPASPGGGGGEHCEHDVMKVQATIGRKNSGPTRAVVMLDSSDDGCDDWLSPAQARSFAAKLLAAADRAEVKYAEWKQQRAAQKAAT